MIRLINRLIIFNRSSFDILGPEEPEQIGRLPVTLICGFLGAGKTSLIRHVLDKKHGEEGYRFAVISDTACSIKMDQELMDFAQKKGVCIFRGSMIRLFSIIEQIKIFPFS